MTTYLAFRLLTFALVCARTNGLTHKITDVMRSTESGVNSYSYLVAAGWT